MEEQQDILLLQRLNAGDKSAYDAIFLKYYRMLCTNAYFILQDESAAKDLVQQFFLEMWDKQLYQQLHGEIKGYLFRAVQNRCLNLLKKQEYQQRELEAYGLQLERDMIPESRSVVLYQQVVSAMSELPVQRQQAFRLVYLQQKKYQEAADDMGISLNSLKTHLKLALKFLREKMKINGLSSPDRIH